MMRHSVVCFGSLNGKNADGSFVAKMTAGIFNKREKKFFFGKHQHLKPSYLFFIATNSHEEREIKRESEREREEKKRERKRERYRKRERESESERERAEREGKRKRDRKRENHEMRGDSCLCVCKFILMKPGGCFFI